MTSRAGSASATARRLGGLAGLAAVPVLVLAVFFVVPVVGMLGRGGHIQKFCQGRQVLRKAPQLDLRCYLATSAYVQQSSISLGDVV